MSKFEKELDGILEIIKDEKFYNSKLYALPSIEELKTHFKDWQPPKQLVEVPQRFADWVESQTDREEESYWYIFDKFIKDSREKSTVIDYFGIGDLSTYPQGWDRVLLSALIDGYTVKKEQLFYLKNKNTGHILYRQPKEAGGDLIEVVATINEEYTWFTQDEIDTMHTGSYERIEVKP